MNDTAKGTAEEIVRHELPIPPMGELKPLVEELKGELEFALARKVLAIAKAEYPTDTWVIQQLALCTYKDKTLLPTKRFGDALALLEKIGLRDPDEAVDKKWIDPQTIPQTLSMGGAGVQK